MPDIQSLLSAFQGGGAGMPQGLALSGQAFPTPLSGIPFGDQGMGGGAGGGGSMSGITGAAPAQGGEAGGIDPLMLQQLMAMLGTASAGAGGSMLGGAGGGALGQYGGGGGYGTAGPTTQQAGTQAGGQAGGMDMKSVLGQLPRLTRIGSQLLSGGDLGTRGYVGGEGTPQGANQSLSDVVRSGQAASAGGGESAPVLQSILGGQSPTNITGQFSPDIMGLFGGAGASAPVLSSILGGASPTTIGGQFTPEIMSLFGGGAGAGAEAAGAGAAAGGAAGAGGAAAGGLATGLGVALPLAAPLLMALPSLIQSLLPEGSYVPTRQKAYSQLMNSLQGTDPSNLGFNRSLQEAMFQGPQAIQAMLGNLGQWGLEGGMQPGGQYQVGLSSVGHPYINQRDAESAQAGLSQSVNQALAQSGMLQQLDPQTRASLLQDLQKRWTDQAAQQNAAETARQQQNTAAQAAAYQGMGY